jgi:hypothetical protein
VNLGVVSMPRKNTKLLYIDEMNVRNGVKKQRSGDILMPQPKTKYVPPPEKMYGGNNVFMKKIVLILYRIRISSFYTKIIKFINFLSLKQVSWLSFIFIILVTAGAATFAYNNTGLNRIYIKPHAFSASQKIDKLYQSWFYYTHLMTKKEFMEVWIDLFADSKYMHGTYAPKGRYDCIGAVATALQYFGANIQKMSVPSLVSLCENYRQKKELEKRVSYNKVRLGDIIVIQTQPNSPSHVGLVWGTNNGWIEYADENVRPMGMGFEHERWGSGRIYAIYELSFPLWAGSILKEYGERPVR